jgi:hypothetical protein
MIVYLVTERFRRTTLPFLKLPGLRGRYRILTYEELFFERAGPIGHYICTDLDRLSRYEIENLVVFLRALQVTAPTARILNHPLTVLDRLPLLTALRREGINDFGAIRLDSGERPASYPVFIRTEDDHRGPETDVLADEAAFDAALADFARRGKPLKGRIAIGYAGEKGSDGLFRKYGALVIGGRIIADELFISDNWAVKDAVAVRRPEQVAEELRYAEENPHAELLRRVFEIAGVSYGRADYAFVNGRMQIYEVNTNPHIPWYDRKDERTERRLLVGRRVREALLAVDGPALPKGRVRFAEIRPGPHDRRLPRVRMPISLARRIGDLFRPKAKPSAGG